MFSITKSLLADASADSIYKWSGHEIRKGFSPEGYLSFLTISTLEGQMVAQGGDWVIRGGTEKDTRAIIELTLNCLKERSQRRRHGEDEMKLEELEFKAEDFIDEENRTAVEELGAVFGFNPITALERLAGMSAARANRILREKLENAPSVFGNKSARGLWCFDEQPLEVDTHKARVVCIEEIKK